MSRCRKNVKKGTKPPTFFQKIAKYLKKARKNRKIFQKMLTLILPILPNRYNLTPQTSFLVQKRLSLRKKSPKIP